VASVIPGAIAAREVEQNLASFRHRIPADFWAELKREKLIRADAPAPEPRA
jgi:D-threo-aldose 1-dehydrogenase